MPDRYYQKTLPNGLTVLGEKMPGVQSAAMTLLLPAGASFDPREASGVSTVLSDLVLRGAGNRNSRELTDYLDSLGLHRSASVGTYHTRFGCAAMAARVIEAVPTYADIVRRPHLPESGFEAARDLAIQAIEGIEDDPRQKVLIKLREWHFPWPFGRNSMGDKQQLEAMKVEAARQQHTERYQPEGMILAMAGDIDFAGLVAAADERFGDWTASKPPAVDMASPPGRIYHDEHPSEQTHIGIAYPAVEETHPDYYSLRLAVEVLSGGMSGRLFTEVREKRGLVYNVWAGYTSLKDRGSILGYAGTSNDRAQATLDTFIAELYRLCDGITADELGRAKTGLKAATIMQGESTSARAGAIAHDFFIRGRIRTLDEMKAAIDGITVNQVNDYLKKNRPGPFTIVTVGPKALKMPE